jgi:hypothetical protein
MQFLKWEFFSGNFMGKHREGLNDWPAVTSIYYHLIVGVEKGQEIQTMGASPSAMFLFQWSTPTE